MAQNKSPRPASRNFGSINTAQPTDSSKVPGIPSGVFVPGFLIVQKNGVIRINPRYRGDIPGKYVDL